MKKIFLTLIFMSILSGAVFAADFSSDDLIAGFKGFSDSIAQSLPLASNIGLNWNDAGLEKFPHLGVGLTVGAVLLPTDSFTAIKSNLGITELDELIGMAGGVPLPVYCLDGRIGIPLLPIDVGVKYGIITPQMKEMLPVDYGFNYSLLGADARLVVLKGEGLLPKISVGAGYTRLSGAISVAGPASQFIDISGATGNTGDNLEINSSDIVLQWTTDVMDFKVQASKKLLFLHVSAGLGYTYGFSSAGGGFSTDLIANSNTLSDEQIFAALSAAGIDASASGISVISEVEGGTLRAFGGVGVQLAILRVDLGAIYGIETGAMAVSANARIQL